jgi:hypothetical protein
LSPILDSSGSDHLVLFDFLPGIFWLPSGSADGGLVIYA